MNISPDKEQFSKTSRDILFITSNDHKEQQKQMVQRLCRMSLQQLQKFVEESMEKIEKEPSMKKSRQFTNRQSTNRQSTNRTNVSSTRDSVVEAKNFDSPKN